VSQARWTSGNTRKDKSVHTGSDKRVQTTRRVEADSFLKKPNNRFPDINATTHIEKHNVVEKFR